MTKYAALGEYLHRQRAARVLITFVEIERMIGGKLPASQRYPAWWSNNPDNNPMTRVWLDAGFQTEQVDIAGRKLVFRKVSADEVSARTADTGSALKKSYTEHPLFERMRGTVHVPDGVDLTEPADPEWGELAYGPDLGKKQA